MPPRIHAEGSMMDGECFEEVESLSTSDALNRLVCKLEDATGLLFLCDDPWTLAHAVAWQTSMPVSSILLSMVPCLAGSGDATLALMRHW